MALEMQTVNWRYAAATWSFPGGFCSCYGTIQDDTQGKVTLSKRDEVPADYSNFNWSEAVNVFCLIIN